MALVTLATDAGAATGTVLSADGTNLSYRAWPQDPSAITFAVVHGLGDHGGRYAAFAEALARRGMGTYAVDLRGHGRSAGQRGHVDSWSQWIDDVAAFVRKIETVVSGEVVPVGHSFGGVALLSTVLAGKLKETNRFVLSSPALKVKVAVPQWKVTLGRMSSRLVPRLALSNEVDPAVISRIPEVVTAYRTDPLVHSKISSRMYTEWQRAIVDIFDRADTINMPFLITAGTADALIDSAGSEELHRRTPRMSELHLMEGRYHEPYNDLQSEEVFSIIESWLKKS